MTIAGVAELKASLSLYLRRVKAGEEVTVTERGRPVARLVPLPRSAGPTQPDLDDLIAAGLARPPHSQADEAFWREFWAMPRAQDPDGLVLKALLEERDEGR